MLCRCFTTNLIVGLNSLCIGSKNFLNNCSGICLQFCTLPCSYTEAVTLPCVLVSVAGSDSDDYPCSHPASFCVGLSSLALSATNIL